MRRLRICSNPATLAIFINFTSSGCAQHQNPESIPDRMESQVQTQIPPETPQVAPPNPAGTVTSGGGLIYGATGNPWFMDDQPSPTWCILIDHENFGMSLDHAESHIKAALKEWEPVTGITFTKTDCNEQTDLRFLLGTLSTQDLLDANTNKGFAQHALGKSAGLAVRTQYDEASMRGRGFIYLASETGPLKIQASEIVTHPWQIFGGKIFRVAVMHELGHVFGLQHSHEGDDLMGSRTIEYLLSKKGYVEIPFEPTERAIFNAKLKQLTPLNLVAFPTDSEFEQCVFSTCTRILIHNSVKGKMILQVWTRVNSGGDSFESTDFDVRDFHRFQFQSVTELRTRMIDISPLSRIFRDGEFRTGIIATVGTFSGTMDDGRTMILNWTAGKRPQVIAFKGDRYSVVFN